MSSISSVRRIGPSTLDAVGGVSSWLLGVLGRVTSSGKFVPEIDGLRFIAIMAVVMYHSHSMYFLPGPQLFASTMDTVSAVIRQGWFGVQLFFVISGFILSMPFAESRLSSGRPISLKKYFVRRVTRLEPPYIICLTLCVIVWVIHGGKTFSEQWPHYFSGIVYAHSLIYQEMNPVNFVTWTLEIEVQFYVLAPLLACVFFIRNTWFRRAVICLGIGAAVWQNVYHYSDSLNMTIVGQVRFFLIGFLLADIHLVNWKGRPAKTLLWDLPGLAAWLAIPYLVCKSPQGTNCLLPIAMLIAYMGAFRGRILNKFFANPWIATVGGMCYTIYLYHFSLVWWICRMFGNPKPGPQPQGLVLILISSVGVIAGCSLLFVLFEKPFMRKDWPARLVQRAKQVWDWLIPQPSKAQGAVEMAIESVASQDDE